MEKFNFKVSVETEKETGNLVAVYFQVRNGKAAGTKEFANGNAFADYTSDGKLLGIELLGPCEITVFDKIARKEPSALSQLNFRVNRL